MGEPRLADEFDRLVASVLRALVEEQGVEGRGRLYRAVMSRAELPLLRHALALSGGNQLKAARLLGINRNTLRKRLRLLGLLPEPHGAAPRAPAPRQGPARE
ncbi:MAG: hypothetical protein HYV93_06525 [Candidatus Rokubacteria bacterium]|nr:hypothetical protein [Candidatus Rokubacteria bacterium]